MTAPAPPTDPAKDARFQAAFAHVNGLIEGGARFTDDPADPGGATKFGLSLRFLAAEGHFAPSVLEYFDIGKDGQVTAVDVKNLTVEQAEGVFHQVFWSETNACSLPAPFDCAIYDQSVNDGAEPAAVILQSACNDVGLRAVPPIALDGAIGPSTIERVKLIIATCGTAALLDHLRTRAANRYRLIAAQHPSSQKYLAGWLKRADQLGDI